MIVDGKQIAAELEKEIKEKLKSPKTVHFVLFGKHPASEQFVALKSKVAEKLGITAITKTYPESTTTDEAGKIIENISGNSDGIVVQLPLPKRMDAKKILDAIPPEIDIDVLNEKTKKLFEEGKTDKIPPVARAVSEILKKHDVDLKNKKIVILGNGPLVGQPVSAWLTREKIAHTVNTDLHSADIIISGIGHPHFVTPDMVKDGVVLIDAGTSESGGKFVGDISPDCAAKSALFTPVPGGVGPVTVASLFLNLF